MSKESGYITIDSYANANRIPIDDAIEQVKSGKVSGKEVDGEWLVSEEEISGKSEGAPGVVGLLYFFSVVVFLASLVASYISWPDGYSISIKEYIFPCALFLSGAASSVILSAFAKGLELLHSISVSVRSNA